MKNVKNDGLVLPTGRVVGRNREFFEGVAKSQLETLVVQGQDPSLEGAGFRAGKMISKPTAKWDKKNDFLGYKKLKGNARKTYNRLIARIFRKGGQASADKVKVAIQKQFVSDYLQTNAEKLFKFFDEADVNMATGGALNNQDVSRLLRDLAVPSKLPINTAADLQQHLFAEAALAPAVWCLAEQVQQIKGQQDQIYHGQSANSFFDHDYGAVVEKPALPGDLKKAKQVVAQRELDRAFERMLLVDFKGKNIHDVRFCGNSHNINLYGANIKGLDGSRDAAFRITLRMTAKSIVVAQLQALRGEPLATAVGKLSTEMVKEFLWLMDAEEAEGDNPHQSLLELCNSSPLKLKTLSETYCKVIQGPCGNMQRAAYEVGIPLTAVQHITGRTSLYNFHGNDFNEVSGLQGDPLTRTYMKVEAGTQLHDAVADHPELVHHEKGMFFPIDCVHSQNMLFVPGIEQEATRILRMMLADILPEDCEKLHVKISARATMAGMADKPYKDSAVIGCSRFAPYPHPYAVPDGSTQENLIIEGLEFVYIDGDEVTPLLKATQNHDDAEKGDTPYKDYNFEGPLHDREVNNDGGAHRFMLQSRIQKIVNKFFDVPQAQAVIEEQHQTFFDKLHDMVFGADRPAAAEREVGPTQDERELEALKVDVANRWLHQPAITNGDLQRNGDMFEAMMLEDTPEARLFSILFASEDGHPPRLPNSAEEIAQRLDQAYADNGMPDLHILSIGFEQAATRLEQFFKVRLETGQTLVEGAMPPPGETQTRIHHRPQQGWEGADNRTSSLPAGAIGSVAVPVTVAQVADTVAAAAPSVAGPATAAIAAAGTGVTGAGLVMQGALMGKAASNVSRRLGKISKEVQQSFNQLHAAWSSMRGNTALEAARNQAVQPLKQALPMAATIVQQLQQRVTASNDPTMADAKDGIVKALKEVTQQLRTISDADVLEICDMQAATTSLSIALSISAYLAENQPALKEAATEAGAGLLTELGGWGELLASDRFALEAELTTKMESLNTALRENKTARKDNEVIRWSGAGYAGGGGAFVASVTPLAAVAPFLGPVGTGILTLVYTGNFINTVRDERRTAASQLDVQAGHPWAPKNVGYDAAMLHRQAEQVELDRLKNLGLTPTTAGWGLGAAAMLGLTVAGVTAGTGGAAAPVILGVGLGLSTVLNAATYNLFNRHAARSAPFGARVESAVHDLGTNYGARKRTYWSLSKQLPQTQERLNNILEKIEQNARDALAVDTNLYPMKKGAKSPLVQRTSLMEKTDSRRPFNYFVEKFFRPNHTRLAQARAIREAFTKDWQADVHGACYAFRLYAEHEINTLRDRAKSLVASHELLARQIKEVSDLVGDPNAEVVRHLRVEKEAVAQKVQDVAAQMRAVKSFGANLRRFEKDYHNFKLNNPATDAEHGAMKDGFENLIVDFAHRMGLLANVYSRGDTKKLAKQFPQDLQVQTYGRLQHIANVKCPVDVELSPQFKTKLKGDAFKSLANLLVFSMPNMLRYEVEKLLQIEEHGRKPAK
ncbi:MAG: hypothetical protein KTR20_01575 [Cellvibrionaceae bacterium]|nr:hypothetical protein [Cellvibrionaceae bacterium]